jgi:hypothetical protein
MQGMPGLESVLPDFIDTHETTPKVAHKGNIQKKYQHEDKIYVV